ncbi:DUF2182 domain-containing protein [Ovoidimarina sediminis]|uniref:DUF2182 domain-containing protein n=1 Tax=Ovoidimarina sediminis TaxID=3079856 RepID=UPI00290CD5BA|nr:DUF2182 domain-containing protein [Rhodophyticola sp. MJ-SS7]MDU8945739.1 DUF2182 domain-containing protein [Rhodophyticola sp. MJ-SS7]
MGGGAVERLLRRDGLVTLGALGLLVLIAALYTVFGVGMSMSAIDMTRMARPIGAPMQMGMEPEWSPGYAVLVFMMWWVMMVAMMTPSAAPFVLLFAAVKRAGPEAAMAGRLSTALLAGYLAVWALFSASAVALQYAGEASGLLNGAMMTLEGKWLAAGVLICAGLYQLTPLKTACLRKCRAPGQFLAEHRRPGLEGAFRMGVAHGLFCLGCCWAIMALLFVGGIMNLVWIAGLTAYVLVEKLLPGGEVIAKLAGAALILLGASVALS